MHRWWTDDRWWIDDEQQWDTVNSLSVHSLCTIYSQSWSSIHRLHRLHEHTNLLSSLWILFEWFELQWTLDVGSIPCLVIFLFFFGLSHSYIENINLIFSLRYLDKLSISYRLCSPHLQPLVVLFGSRFPLIWSIHIIALLFSFNYLSNMLVFLLTN